MIGYVLTGALLHPGAAAPSGKYFDHVVTILMENNDLQSVLSQGTFQASLASQYTLSTGYSAVSHPSEPNYSALISGQIGPNSGDGICCGQDSHMNIVDSLESHGLTWKAFAEGLTNGDCTGAGIDTDHYPFLYFSDIVDSPPRCGDLLGTSASSDTQFISALNAANGWPNYIWLTPNTKDDAHDTSIAFGDSYLAGLVPKILSSTLFTTQNAALFIVYDEGSDVPCFSGGPDCVYASWSGTAAKKGFTSTNSYTHYSYLHTIEDNWAFPTLTSNDAGASVMSEFFTASAALSTSVSFTPSTPSVGQTVTFSATVSGGTPPYGVGWDFGDGQTSVGLSTTHVFSNTGTFNVTAAVTDSATPAHIATTSVFVAVQPSISPDFQIFESPASLTIPQGGTGLATITLTSIGSFTGTVGLADTVSPSGLSASFNVTSVQLSAGDSVSSALTLSASSLTGGFSVNVTGTGGSLTHSALVSVTVVSHGTPGFSLSVSSSSLKIPRGSSANLTVTLTSLTSFSGNVDLSASASAPGAAITFDPSTVVLSANGSANSLMTITIASTATAHVYKIIVTGTSGAISNSTAVTLRVLKHSVVKVQGLQTVQPGQTVSLMISPMALESGDSVTMRALGIPQGAMFDTSTGFLTWTPALSQGGGTYTITFIATHDVTPSISDYQFVEITVQKANTCFICSLFPQSLSMFWLAVLGVGVGLSASGAVGAAHVYRSARRTLWLNLRSL